MTKRLSAPYETYHPSAHAGLWLDKYYVLTGKDSEAAKTGFIRSVSTQFAVSDIYVSFFKRWQNTLQALGAVATEAEVAPHTRLAVGLGQSSILEVGITLHRTYGVPYIPGTALKGVARQFALESLGPMWRAGTPAFEIVFGSEESAGYVTFYDALPYVDDQSRSEDVRLDLDVMSIHHPLYYRGQMNGESLPPSDMDDPVIVPFLTTRGRFLIALSGPEEWVMAAYEILSLATEKVGVGAKTSSGYGRLSIDVKSLKQRMAGERQALEAQKKAEAETELERMLSQMSGSERLVYLINNLETSERDRNKSKGEYYQQALKFAEQGDLAPARALKAYWQKTNDWNVPKSQKKQIEKMTTLARWLGA